MPLPINGCLPAQVTAISVELIARDGKFSKRLDFRISGKEFGIRCDARSIGF